MLSVVIYLLLYWMSTLSVIMLNVVVLSVVAPLIIVNDEEKSFNKLVTWFDFTVFVFDPTQTGIGNLGQIFGVIIIWQKLLKKRLNLKTKLVPMLFKKLHL